MSQPSIFTKRGVIGLALLLCSFATAAANPLEFALMPGPVIKAHADIETECSNCHVILDRAAQPGLCSACHDDVAEDVVRKTGFHGRIEQSECRACHSEHKGRDADIIGLQEGRFDHRLTDFVLRGKHTDVGCGQCHVENKPHRVAASECSACHDDDDVHRTALGTQCATCHQESGWEGATFEHDSTGYRLRFAHQRVQCTSCHFDHRYADTPNQCVGCHGSDDVHYEALGERCESCHAESSWNKVHFDHERDTTFALLGAHEKAQCEACHADSRFRQAPATTCAGCHAQDDVHKRKLGTDCAICHTQTAWTQTVFEHQKHTQFPLRGAHSKAVCDACHRDTVFVLDTPTRCADCHRKDDARRGHRGKFGTRCESCHVESAWRSVRFDHRKTSGFALAGAHRPLRCTACHAGVLYEDKVSARCESCHSSDDVHEGALGRNCASCHVDVAWKKSTFNHSRTPFPLAGKHRQVKCTGCHEDSRFTAAGTLCVSCHDTDDRHERRLGPRCETCHKASSWSAASFDHNAGTSFKLDGAHSRVACEACHREPINEVIELPGQCLACHRKDDVHFKSLGERCDACHVSDNWRNVSNQAREWADKGRPPDGTAARP